MFVLIRLAKKVFFQLHSKYEVGLSRHILLLSCLSQTKHSNIANTFFARESYSLSMVSLETFQLGYL